MFRKSSRGLTVDSASQKLKPQGLIWLGKNISVILKRTQEKFGTCDSGGYPT